MYDNPIPEIHFLTILPITMVVLTGMICLAIELIRPKGTNTPVVFTALLGLIAAGVAVGFGFNTPEGETFNGMALRDNFGSIIQLILLLGAFVSILFSEPYLRQKRIAFGEFYPLALWSVSGAMMMSTTKNLLMIFIGLEVLSVSLYVLSGMSRSEERSEESALKYFLLGAFASGFLLYGIAFVYGATGGLHLDGVASAWENGSLRTCIVLGLGFLLVGLGFKASFVPFHQWAPDVYQGAPTNVTAFMAAIAKIGALAALWRVLDAFSLLQSIWLPALFWVAILTMCLGNVVALVQKDAKRILGYSSIAHAGYLLVAVLAHAKNPTQIGYGTVTYYLLSYSLMTIGAFAVISLTAKDGKEGTRLEDLKGLAQRLPLAATCLVIFMFSLVGLPPTSGFLGKLFIFNDAVNAGLTPLAIILAVNSIVSCYYYLGIVWAALSPIKGDENTLALLKQKPSFGATSACLVCAVGIFAAVLLNSPLQAFLNSK